MRRVIRIKNLDCAACAAELKEELEELKDIEEAAVDFINQRVTLSYNRSSTATLPARRRAI